jgi:hypothetical protein
MEKIRLSVVFGYLLWKKYSFSVVVGQWSFTIEKIGLSVVFGHLLLRK